MALNTLINWIAKDLRQGRGFALVVATSVSAVGLVTAAAMILIMPLTAETMIQAHITNDRIFMSLPKHWHDANQSNSHFSFRCRDSAFSTNQDRQEAVTISVAKPPSLSCRNSESAVALLSYNISLWTLAKHRTFVGAPLIPAAFSKEKHDMRPM
jgi:hypothetical protein